MTTTLAEPEWDDDTREVALGLDGYDASLCPSCGRPASVCQAADAEFVADLPVRCHATTALLVAQSQVSDETHPQSQALLWSVRRRDEVSGD